MGDSEKGEKERPVSLSLSIRYSLPTLRRLTRVNTNDQEREGITQIVTVRGREWWWIGMEREREREPSQRSGWLGTERETHEKEWRG